MEDYERGRQRFVADRFRRIWAVVEYVAANPGTSRAQIAQHFHLSERQVQADLNIIREDMNLPLVRESGYRFASDANAPAVLRDRDLMVLAQILGSAVRRSLPASEADPIRELAARLTEAFPPHLQPLARLLLGNLGHSRRQIADALLAAIVGGTVVRLHHPPGVLVPGWIDDDLTVRPDLLFPHGRDWYLLATDARGRTRMVSLAAVESVSRVNRSDWPAALRSAS